MFSRIDQRRSATGEKMVISSAILYPSNNNFTRKHFMCKSILKVTIQKSWKFVVEPEVCSLVGDEFCRAVWDSYRGPLFLLKPEKQWSNSTYSSSHSSKDSCLQRPPKWMTHNLTNAIVFSQHTGQPLHTVADSLIVRLMYQRKVSISAPLLWWLGLVWVESCTLSC